MNGDDRHEPAPGSLDGARRSRTPSTPSLGERACPSWAGRSESCPSVSGIAAPTLRSWDRRHGVGPSLRTSGNHRRYTELDIRRVLLMSRLTAQGVPAQSAADSVLAMDAALADRRRVPRVATGR